MTEEQQNLSRRERRAQAAGKGEEGEDLKDRNQKMRAEAAAKRRKARESERKQAAEEGLDAAERVDDAFARGTQATGQFLRRNFAWMQWIIIAGVVGAVGVLIFNYRKSVDREKQGTLVASVLRDQFGKVVSAEPTPPSDPRLVDPRAEFKTQEEQDKAALAAWDRLAKSSSPELQLAGKLGRAGALYDARKFKEARAAYEEALTHPQMALSPQMKGRALEGIGFTIEAEQKYEEAKKAFEKLASVSLDEFKKLQTFHVARMNFLLDKSDEAKKALEELDKKLSVGADARGPTDYIGAAVRDLLKTVDPSRAASEQEAISAEQMKKLMEQFEQMQKQQGGMPEMPESLDTSVPEVPMPAPDAAPAPPAPAPGAPAPTAPKGSAPVAPQTAPAAPAPAPAPPVPAPVAPAPQTIPAPQTVPAPQGAPAP